MGSCGVLGSLIFCAARHQLKRRTWMFFKAIRGGGHTETPWRHLGMVESGNLWGDEMWNVSRCIYIYICYLYYIKYILYIIIFLYNIFFTDKDDPRFLALQKSETSRKEVFNMTSSPPDVFFWGKFGGFWGWTSFPPVNDVKEPEQWKKGPWLLVGLYRGWQTTQLYRDYFINHYKDPY